MIEARKTSNKRSFLSIRLLGICLASVWSSEIFHVDASQCGKVSVSTPLVIGGGTVRRGQWPFLAALFRVKQNQFDYFCGGTVISTNHILTAAHCIQGKYSSDKLSADDISVRVGAFNLTATNEYGAVQLNISEIYVHREWDIYNDRYDADIAILVVRQSVTFSNHIQPVCMPPDDVIIDDVEGHIVGWGLSDNESYGEIPRHAIVKAINDSHCYREDVGVIAFSSLRTFCSGRGDGVPNRGDSGGGLFALQNGSWVQNGIISVLRTNMTGHVTLDSFSIYTNVKMFKDWILETIDFQENRIHFYCSYEYKYRSLRNTEPENEYECRLRNLNIHKKYVEVASFSGYHQRGQTDDNVEALYFDSGSMFYLPHKVGDFFVNLKKLQIHQLMGTKLITRSNLKNLKYLTFLSIWQNDIVFLERDFLWDLPQLTEFLIRNNKLKSLHEESFEKNLNLIEVHLNGNYLESLPRNLFFNNVKLGRINLSNNRLQMLPANIFQRNPLLLEIYLDENLLKSIPENTFNNNVNLKRVDLSGNQIEILPVNLFRGNLLLEVIDLSRNLLNRIDANVFINNIHLKRVDLSENQIEILPVNLFQKNTLLDDLNLYKNHLNSIDANAFINNTHLKSVGLSSNRLEMFPANLFQTNPLLETIYLGNNSLKIISKNTFNNNVNLKRVDLSQNQIEMLPVNLFQGNQLLVSIALNNNSLKSIDENTFINNTNLEVVSLEFNQLQMLSVNLFKRNLVLRTIYLNNNFLKRIEENTFIRNIYLTYLYLQSNQLEMLPANLFKRNRSLVNINLSHNPLKAIATDFSRLSNIKNILLSNTLCINDSFEARFSDLIEFQTEIRTHCS